MTEDDFWQNPLGAWLRDCSQGGCSIVPESSWRLQSKQDISIQYRELCDGVLLSLLFQEIDPRSVSVFLLGEVGVVRDTHTKHRQFHALLEAIRRFYKHRLNQLIVLSPPDIFSIVKNITPDESGEELNKFLLLLLGCAVQGDRKKEFVDRITRLGPETQKGIVRHIQKVTESSSVVLSLRPASPVRSQGDREIVCHLERVMRERDNLAHQVLHMTTNHDTESDEGSSTTATSSLNGDLPRRMTEIRYDRRSPSPPTLDRHCTVELASAKSELRKLRNLTEEKDEEINDLRDELEVKESELLRMQNERLDLVKDARSAKDLRDELDCTQHKLLKLEKLEQENSKLREKLAELEYYRSRTEQLRGENDSLEKTMLMLEDEMEALKQRSKNQMEIESRLEESHETVRNLQADISEKNGRIEELLLEQSRLETELLSHNARIAQMERCGDTTFSPRESFGSLADQLEESERSEVVKLRMELRQLRCQMEKGKEENATTVVDVVPSAKVEELKTELEKKAKETSELRDEYDVITKQLYELEKTLSSINGQFKEATSTLETTREERDEAVKSLHEARRKFTQFQAEFGKKFEEDAEFKIHEIEVELQESRRRLRSAEDEKNETERQLGRVRDEQRTLRVTVDELKEEKHQSELQVSQLERALKNAENEKNLMKDRSEKLENELDSIRMRMLTTDDAAKRLEISERLLVEQQNRLGDIEAENRTLLQQLEHESKKTQRLREDLVGEKTKGADLVGRLRSLCAAVALNGGKIETETDDLKLIESIDDVIMGALTAARREADALRLQQHTQIAELTDLRRDIEKLRRSESASLSESDDRVRELSKENVTIKEQVFILQEKVRELQIETSTKNSEVVIAKREIEELNRNSTAASASNTELARLQVSLRNLQLQEELLKQDNSELRIQLELAEKSRQTAKKDADSLTTMHQALLGNHDRLQNLHDLLTEDYERAKHENQDMKGRLRTQRPSPVPTRELEELRSALSLERSTKDKQLRAYADLHNEHGAFKREMDILRKENDSLSRSCDGLQSEIRNLKLGEQSQRATIRDLNTTIDDMSRSMQQKDLEIAKLQHRIEMLAQLNRTYDEESKNLARQVEMLLQQNKELLNRALNDKDQYHQEQKDFQERLTSLRRHKEKLEEKIMDQYRSMENKRCNGTKQPLVKRAAKALINRRRPSQPSSNGGSTTEDSSAYSADEAPPPFHDKEDDFDIFPPTCSSSEDADRISPRYETISSLRDSVSLGLGSFRDRNDVIGGSVRVPSGVRRPVIQPNTFEKISYNGPERAVEAPSYLPPRAPVRNSSVTASLRARPPPPPYPKTKPPPPYNAQTSTPVGLSTPMSGSPVLQFAPNCASTPKSDRGSPPRENEDRDVVAEGERRIFIREKEERVDKAMSIYENVQQPEAKGPNESTVWYEYGCV